MNQGQDNALENYYTSLKGVELYVDYINERLKILNYSYISQQVIDQIIDYAKQRQLGKIISNCRANFLELFIDCNFLSEGKIAGFFQGEEAYCITYFIKPARKLPYKKETKDTILQQCLNITPKLVQPGRQEYIIRYANVKDIPQMIKLFSTVFASYPAPVFSSKYLQQVMGDQVLFRVAEEKGKIISIASADMDKLNRNAEITDCATYPEHRGRGILQNLINKLEDDLREQGFYTAYSLSRAINPGINKALSRLQYKYGGRLVNNCHISGRFEDMNIWVKIL